MKETAFWLAVILVCVPAGFMVAAWPFMWLWNYAVVQGVSIANPLTYWPALWLMVFIALFLVGARQGIK